MNYQNFASIEPQLQPHFAGANTNPAGFREFPAHFSQDFNGEKRSVSRPHARYDEGQGIPQLTANNTTITDKINV